MDVKAGYKLTEVGVIPEDWEVTYLGKYAAFKTGPFGSALHQSDYVDGGIPVINPMQIDDGKIMPTASMTISEQAAKKLSAFRLQAGDIVIGRRGEMGRCAVVNAEQIGWLCGTGSMIVRVNAMADSRFIQRILSSPAVIAEIENASVGSTMINLNQSVLRNLAVALPTTRKEQEAIAGALSDADALVESLEQLIAKKRQIKQGAMQALLTGKRRLSNGEDSWTVKRFGDIATFFSGGTPSTAIAEYYTGAIPWITSSDLNKGYITEVEGRISELGLQNSAAKMVQPDTLLLALYGATAGVAAICKIRASINQAVLAIVPFRDDSYFLYFLLIYLKEWLISTYTQGGQPNLSGEIIKSIEINLPPVEEQRAIAGVLSDMDAEIAALADKLNKARQIKQGMMQELLTGRIRLNV